MRIAIILVLATLLPLFTYIAVGFSRRSRAEDESDYFIYSQRVSAQDYATTSVGYALQMAAMFLFAYWGAIYGLGALWAALFWAVGYFVLYRLLNKMIPYHEQSEATTLHQYLADSFAAGKPLQTLAAIATIIGLWGTMMLEIDYTLQTYRPIITNEVVLSILGGGFLIFGVIYIVKNGYKAEVNTERFQVPCAYGFLIAVLLVTLPGVWVYGGKVPYFITSAVLIGSLLLIIIGKLQQGIAMTLTSDRQILIPLLGVVGYAIIHFGITRKLAPGNSVTVLDQPLNQQLKAQGYFGLLSLFVANAFWMPVDLSTWQRIASVEGKDSELLRNLRKGTRRIMFESPASWCLGVVLGLIINGSGILRPAQDASEGLSAFSAALLSGTNIGYLGWAVFLIYPAFLIACISIMLSTVDSLISAIAFTAHRDLPPYTGSGKMRSARLWTVCIALAGLAIYPAIRWLAGANLSTLLYASYSAQLSLLVIVLLALAKKRLSKRAAIWSLLGGFLATVVCCILAVRIPSNPQFAVLPPIFAILGAAAGYIFGYKEA